MKLKALKILLLCSLIPLLFFALFIAFTSYLNKSKEKEGVQNRDIAWEEQIVKDNPIILEEFSDGGGRYADISAFFPANNSTILVVFNDKFGPYISLINGHRVIKGKLEGRSDNTFDMKIINPDKTVSYISLGEYNGNKFSGNLDERNDGGKDNIIWNASLAILAFLFCFGGYCISCINFESEWETSSPISGVLSFISFIVLGSSLVIWMDIETDFPYGYFVYLKIFNKEIIFPLWFCISEIGFLAGISCYLTKKQKVKHKVYRDFFDRNRDKLPKGASPKGVWKEVDGESVIIIDEKGYFYYSSNNEHVENFQIRIASDGMLILKGNNNIIKLAKFRVDSKFHNIRSVEFEERQFTKTGHDIDSEVNQIKLKKEKKRTKNELFEKVYSILLNNLSISTSEVSNRIIKWSALTTGIFLLFSLCTGSKIYGNPNYKVMTICLIIALIASIFLIRNLWLKYFVEKKRERLRDIIKKTMENEKLSQDEIIKSSEETFINKK